MNNKNLGCGEYFVTIIISIVVVVIFAISFELELLFRCENQITKYELNTANLDKFVSIEQIERILEKDPNNYPAMIKLAKIYEELGQDKHADEYYNNALNVSEKSNYAAYNYAMYLAKRNNFLKSSALAENMVGTNKKSVEYRARIYELIADNMLKRNDAPGSIRAYQVAYKYAKSVYKEGELKNLETKYIDSHLKLADFYVSQYEIPEALAVLESSKKIGYSPLVTYKIGLLNIDTDKAYAERLLKEVLDKNPYIVNPYIYNNLTNDLINKAKKENNRSALNFYEIRQERFKKIVAEIYLYKKDLMVEHVKIVKHKDKCYIVFNLKNSSNKKIQQLFLNVDIFLNAKQYNVNKKIAGIAKAIEPGAIIKNIKLELDENAEIRPLRNQNDAIIKFYAKKQQKAPDTLVGISHIVF